MEIRLSNFSKHPKNLVICPHVELEEAREDSSPYEYEGSLKIHCKLCDETFEYIILIN